MKIKTDSYSDSFDQYLNEQQQQMGQEVPLLSTHLTTPVLVLSQSHSELHLRGQHHPLAQIQQHHVGQEALFMSDKVTTVVLGQSQLYYDQYIREQQQQFLLRVILTVTYISVIHISRETKNYLSVLLNLPEYCQGDNKVGDKSQCCAIDAFSGWDFCKKIGWTRFFPHYPENREQV